MAGKKQRRGRQGKRRGGRKSTNVADHATLSESQSMYSGNQFPGTPGDCFLFNSLYMRRSVKLADFARASAVAKAYQYYRIKNIRITLRPTYDTTAPQTSQPIGGLVKPSLYYMLDKSGSIPLNVSLEGLKQMGARPIAFDEKPVKISYAPSVLSLVDSNGMATSTGAQYKISPWISTNAVPGSAGALNPSTVDHLGVFWYNNMPNLNFENQQKVFYTCEIECQFEFKKPIWTASLSDTNAVEPFAAVLDTSPDGVANAEETIPT